MKKHLLIFLSLFFSGYAAVAQNFSGVVSQINTELKTVENGKSKIAQSISEVQPGVIKISITTTLIKDGKTNSDFFELNMADIDINTISVFTDKDVIMVRFSAAKNQKLINKKTDANKSSFDQEIKIFAKDIDNGRNLVQLFKSLMPLSNEIIDKRLSLKTYDEHLNWLEKNISDVNSNQIQRSQKIKSNSKYPGKLDFSIDEIVNQKTSSDLYSFNLANINPNSIFSEIKNDVIVVNIETSRKLKFIKTFSSNVQKDYVSNFSIFCENVEKSRDLQKVLKGIIALSENKIKNSIPKISSVKEGLALINANIKNINSNMVVYDQSFSENCISKFTSKAATPTKIVEDLFEFNFKDLGKNLVEFSTKGKNVIVKIKTSAGNDYIKHSVDSQTKNYTDAFELQFAEIEDGLIAQELFHKIIELCQNNENKWSGTKNDWLQQLKGFIKKVEVNKIATEQILESKDGIIQFKTTEINEKSSKSKLYEFNLKDINPLTITFKTSGTNVFVVVNTNFMEKIIKYYEDGAIKNYQNTFNIAASNIEESRSIAELIKKITAK